MNSAGAVALLWTVTAESSFTSMKNFSKAPLISTGLILILLTPSLNPCWFLAIWATQQTPVMWYSAAGVKH
jgi:hypothetical protein